MTLDSKRIINCMKLEEWLLLAVEISKDPSNRIVMVDLAHCHRKEDAINRIAYAANASEEFGSNYDALADVLSDRPMGVDILVLFSFHQLKKTWQRVLSQIFNRCKGDYMYGEGTVRIVILADGFVKS